MLRNRLRLTPVILIISISTSWAQVEIAAGASYELPLDELKWVYKPGKSYQLTISKTDRYKNKRTSWGINLGYASFVPKEALFYYLVNEDEIGTIAYENYNLYLLTVNARRDFILNKNIEIFLGTEFGLHYAQYGYVSDDSYIDEDATYVEGRGAVSPKAGITFTLTAHLSIFVQSRYNVSVGESNFTASSNIFNYSWSNGVGVNLRFE
jgi:hypothetical protein